MDNCSITTIIAKRIRAESLPQAMVMADAMHKRLEAELAALGVGWYDTCLHQFVQEVRDRYLIKLVDGRMNALVDQLIASVPAGEPVAVDAMGCVTGER